MAARWGAATDISIGQLFNLGCCSNGRLYAVGTKLGLIDPSVVKKDSFHYHVDKQNWRQEIVRHEERGGSRKGLLPGLAGCRLGSSPRLQFSVRLVPISFYIREARESAVQAVPHYVHVKVYGVLGLVQELCSGLLRAELLLDDAPERNDIYQLPEVNLIDFVARSISLAGLKCAAVHFPKVSFTDHARQAGVNGLIGGWLGVKQPENTAAALNMQFEHLAEKIIEAARWGAAAHKIRPEASAFKMDFPMQQENALLDLTRPCGKGWAKDTLTRQLRERLDRFNTAIDVDATKLSPALRLWIAKLCYYPNDRDNEPEQRAALEQMVRAVSYRKRIPPEEIELLKKAGIDHLHVNTYPTTK